MKLGSLVMLMLGKICEQIDISVLTDFLLTSSIGDVDRKKGVNVNNHDKFVNKTIDFINQNGDVTKMMTVVLLPSVVSKHQRTCLVGGLEHLDYFSTYWE
jgi:hypothetical protein